MNEQQSGCGVASYTKCNTATTTHGDATISATENATSDLLVLAKRVLERNSATFLATKNATHTLLKDVTTATINNKLLNKHVHVINRTMNNAVSKKSCIVASAKESNYATGSVCQICGYNKPFCSCKIPCPGTVTCNDCRLFIPDNIGDGVGIGRCELGVTWTTVFNRRKMPLYRYSERYCDKFIKLMSE